MEYYLKINFLVTIKAINNCLCNNNLKEHFFNLKTEFNKIDYEIENNLYKNSTINITLSENELITFKRKEKYGDKYELIYQPINGEIVKSNASLIQFYENNIKNLYKNVYNINQIF